MYVYVLLFYGHICVQGKRNEPSDNDAKWRMKHASDRCLNRSARSLFLTAISPRRLPDEAIDVDV